MTDEQSVAVGDSALDGQTDMPVQEPTKPKRARKTAAKAQAKSKTGARRGNRPGANNRDGIYKFNSIKKGKYIELLLQGGRRHASARSIKINPATVALHMKSDPDFCNRVLWAEMESDDEVEDALRMAAISGNVTACLAWLYSRRPERWSDTRHVKLDNETLAKDLLKKCAALGIDPWVDPVLASILSAAGAVRDGGAEDSGHPADGERGGPGADQRGRPAA